MTGEDAALLAETLASADLRGVHSHGVLRLPEYVEKLLGKRVDPRGRPQVVRDSGSALVVDGGNSMGQIGSVFAMRRAIERARASGVAAAVRGSNHCGAMAYYAMLALPGDMIGLATTNALPTVAPWGGTDKIVGINPLAGAIPAGEEPPVVLDAAFSYSSHGKIRVYHQKGQPIPPRPWPGCSSPWASTRAWAWPSSWAFSPRCSPAPAVASSRAAWWTEPIPARTATSSWP
jgi:LDH2 family malate/lactate/ureidoglycolate dehydrogenase